MERRVLNVVMAGIFFVLGGLTERICAEKYWRARLAAQEVIAQYRTLEARRGAGFCYSMMADHWSQQHLNVPGTPEIVTVANNLAESYRKEK